MKLNPSFAAGYASPCGVGFRKVVKCTIMIKKKAGMTDEDFVSYYNTRHARMATEVVVRYQCITYSLVSRLLGHAKVSIWGRWDCLLDGDGVMQVC